MKQKKTKTSWQDVKSRLAGDDKGRLTKLIGELYSLSPENRRFIHARYCLDNPRESYKEIIERCLYPDPMKDDPVKFPEAERAIRQFSKANDDPKENLDLMIFFVECGNDFTVEFGDMDEHFYSRLESMVSKILVALKQQDKETRDIFFPRLQSIAEKADPIGWGYSDFLNEALYSAFPEEMQN